jgi:3-hydroxyisobutyrate dehydrogenase-like beta-hydroxyacid dehydrogenase
MTSKRIGLLHPGEMGASIGAAARAVGTSVCWASAGRSDASRRRAAEAGIEDAHTLAALAARSDVILSVCPPEAASSLAESVLGTGFTGIFVDANAVSSGTARDLASMIEDAGAHFVDGGIIGPPARREGSTRLYLSGAEASSVASAFQGSPLEAVVIGPRPGAASALKMSYAAWTKGSAALLTAIRALARAEGVEAALLEEWSLSQPGLEARSAAGARNNAFKAWRFAGEMREIATTFEACGLPGGFHQAAADIYQRLAAYKDCDPAPELSEVMDTILGTGT